MYITSHYRELILSQQHGFTMGKYTQTNLALYHNVIVNTLENKSHVDSIYTDFSKAFDMVHHTILILELCYFGFKVMTLIVHKVLNLKHSSLKNSIPPQKFLRVRPVDHLYLTVNLLLPAVKQILFLISLIFCPIKLNIIRILFIHCDSTVFSINVSVSD